MERRALKGLRLEQRDNSEMPTLRGHAAVFDSEADIGWFTETVRRGAFTRSLAEGPDTAALVNHDANLIIGRKSAGTLRMSEDEVGLAIEVDLPNTTAGRDLVESIRRGDLSGMSFSFSAKADKWGKRDGRDFRELIDVNLHDVSVVASPAYADTHVGLRSQDGDSEAKASWLLAHTVGGLRIRATAMLMAAEA